MVCSCATREELYVSHMYLPESALVSKMSLTNIPKAYASCFAAENAFCMHSLARFFRKHFLQEMNELVSQVNYSCVFGIRNKLICSPLTSDKNTSHFYLLFD